MPERGVLMRQDRHLRRVQPRARAQRAMQVGIVCEKRRNRRCQGEGRCRQPGQDRDGARNGAIGQGRRRSRERTHQGKASHRHAKRMQETGGGHEDLPESDLFYRGQKGCFYAKCQSASQENRNIRRRFFPLPGPAAYAAPPRGPGEERRPEPSPERHTSGPNTSFRGNYAFMFASHWLCEMWII
ncbi:protein of unknown function [Rhodovastum atsumiense]|nr:protein of unknown function [Rhodovastum atsumiense]